MDLTHDDVVKILKIIDESNYDDVRLEVGDLKLHVQKQGASGPEAEPAPSRAAAPPPAQSRSSPRQAPAEIKPLPPKQPANVAPAEIPEGLLAVRAPMLGTFYRAPAPGEKPFVEVGSKVGPNDTVCLVEVMKLFNSIKAGVAGTVVKILVENATLVEHDQQLILIEHDLVGPANDPD